MHTAVYCRRGREQAMPRLALLHFEPSPPWYPMQPSPLPPLSGQVLSAARQCCHGEVFVGEGNTHTHTHTTQAGQTHLGSRLVEYPDRVGVVGVGGLSNQGYKLAHAGMARVMSDKTQARAGCLKTKCCCVEILGNTGTSLLSGSEERNAVLTDEPECTHKKHTGEPFNMRPTPAPHDLGVEVAQQDLPVKPVCSHVRL